ncbi:RIP metalloprotease RseP [bacterium]|nr:RIP metalloprotease RseP [bacterium]
METVFFIVSFLFVFGLVVFVHELGHFLAAKSSGLTVLEFGFGYPPAAFKKKVGETTYSLNWIPFGGFVKILGEEGDEGGKKNPKSFASQSKLTKSKILVAGVLMNWFLAAIIFCGLYIFGFYPLIPGASNHTGVSNQVFIEEFSDNSPAKEAGLKVGDKLISVSNNSISSIDDLQKSVSEKVGQSVDIKVKRDNSELVVKVVPYEEEIEGVKKGRVGVAISEIVKADNIFTAITAGFKETFRLSIMAVAGIFGFFGSLFTKLRVDDGAVGPVGMAVITNEMRKLGFAFLMQFTAVISLSLAFLNIMPIPALDGGHLFMLLIEKIRGKDISDKTKNRLVLIGFGFMILLMLVITSKDISRFDIIGSIKNLFGW